MRPYVLAALPVLVLAGCNAPPPPAPNAAVAPNSALGAQPASKEPESANSLPRGDQTNSTLTPGVGDGNSARVGPATPVRRPTTTGY